MYTHADSAYDKRVTLTFDLLNFGSMHAKQLPYTACPSSYGAADSSSCFPIRAWTHTQTDRHTHSHRRNWSPYPRLSPAWVKYLWKLETVVIDLLIDRLWRQQPCACVEEARCRIQSCWQLPIATSRSIINGSSSRLATRLSRDTGKACELLRCARLCRVSWSASYRPRSYRPSIESCRGVIGIIALKLIV